MIVWTGFDRRPRLYRRPEEVIRCEREGGLGPAFARMERALARGRHLAGFLSYESGYGLEPRLRARSGGPGAGFPLLCFGVYEGPRAERPSPIEEAPRLWDGRVNRTRGQYDADIHAIREWIARGDVYQITYCLKLKFGFSGGPWRLFRELYRAQPVPYPAFIDDGERRILSLAPELFLRKHGTRIETRPMKGTWPRGRGPRSDRLARRRFERDPKNRAENVMIADLLRNDLGRVGERIEAPRLFTVTGYRTLFQMTSTVAARVPRDLPLRALFGAVFPSGSVTGTPRIRAMEIIRDLEPEPRRIYTGAIGYVTPDRDLMFNVPIRTLLIQGRRGEMGVGGGIVWDSTADGEWAEGRLKARFLTESPRLAWPWRWPDR